MYEFYIENIHWFDHAMEALTMFTMISVIVVLLNVMFDHNRLYEDFDWMAKHKVQNILIHIILFLILLFVSHYISEHSDVDLWNHRNIIEERQVHYP